MAAPLPSPAAASWSPPTRAVPNFALAGSGGVTLSGQGSTFAVTAGSNAGELAESQVDGLLTTVNFGAGTNLGIAVQSPETFTLMNSIGGSQGLMALGSGTLVLGASNSYTGGTTIAAGAAIELQNPAAGHERAGEQRGRQPALRRPRHDLHARRPLR